MKDAIKTADRRSTRFKAGFAERLKRAESIRKMREQGVSRREIARQFQLSITRIQQIEDWHRRLLLNEEK